MKEINIKITRINPKIYFPLLEKKRQIATAEIKAESFNCPINFETTTMMPYDQVKNVEKLILKKT